MEEKNTIKPENQSIAKNNYWKKFFKEQIFISIVGIIAFIVYLIIYHIKKDITYLYLSIGVIAAILLWISLEALIWFIKIKKLSNQENSEISIEQGGKAC